MAKYAFNYDSGEYEYIERDGFSIDRVECVYDSEYRREEKEEEERRREERRMWNEN